MYTIVTGLFDIKRNNMDGRSWNDYLDWFGKTLSINCPMVVYVEEKTISFVEQKRNNFPTKIISKKIEDLEYFQYKNDIDRILSSKMYLNSIKDPNRIECKYSLYNIIQYSKFEFVHSVSKENPFNSDYFIWMDAGLSRFFDNLNTNNEYPSKNFKLKNLELKNKMLIQTFASYYPDLFYAKNLSKDYLLDNRSYVMGGMFCSDAEGIKKVKQEIDLLLKNMLEDNIINNEQIALGYLFKNNPDLFISFINKVEQHRNYELINVLSF